MVVVLVVYALVNTSALGTYISVLVLRLHDEVDCIVLRRKSFKEIKLVHCSVSFWLRSKCNAEMYMGSVSAISRKFRYDDMMIYRYVGMSFTRLKGIIPIYFYLQLSLDYNIFHSIVFLIIKR